MSLLKAMHLSYSYHSSMRTGMTTDMTTDFSALISDITLEVAAGQALQIIGENGQGKTTLLRILAGLLPPYQGSILWNGRSIWKFPEIYRSDLIYLGHQLGLKPYLTAEENLIFSARLRGYEIDRGQLQLFLDRVRLKTHHQQLTYQLSAGQRQRLALARLLASPSRIWILDEPFNVLSEKGQSLMIELIQDYLYSGGCVVFTSHLTLSFPVSLKIFQFPVTPHVF